MRRRRILEALTMGAQIAALVVIGVVATGYKAVRVVCGNGKRRRKSC